MADISFTKEAAARCQLDAAVRMLFLHKEDMFAVHTVAASARSILKDLAAARGVGHQYEASHALEKLPEYAELNLDDPKVAGEIAERARKVERDKRTHSHRNKSANFLKHADTDAKATLNLNEIDSVWIIAEAINLWLNLGLRLTDEMFVFARWYHGATASKEHDFILTKEGPIHLFTFEQQIEFGTGLLMLIYDQRGRASDQFRNDALFKSVREMPVRMFTALE